MESICTDSEKHTRPDAMSDDDDENVEICVDSDDDSNYPETFSSLAKNVTLSVKCSEEEAHNLTQHSDTICKERLTSTSESIKDYNCCSPPSPSSSVSSSSSSLSSPQHHHHHQNGHRHNSDTKSHRSDSNSIDGGSDNSNEALDLHIGQNKVRNDDNVNNNNNNNNNMSPPVRLTNFSISNILQPEFGCNNPRTRTWFFPNSDHNDLKSIRDYQKLAWNHHHHHHHHHHNSSRSDAANLKHAQDERKRLNHQRAIPENSLQESGKHHNKRVKISDNHTGNHSLPSSGSGGESSHKSGSDGSSKDAKQEDVLWPAWVYCTRYSDRPSSGPRIRKIKKKNKPEEKRPRTAFTNEQLGKLKAEFDSSRYLTEPKRRILAKELGLNESQIKIWYQNKRAKLKKCSGTRDLLATQLMSQGLYNHSLVHHVEKDDDDDDDDC